jgi:hypothetical protein
MRCERQESQKELSAIPSDILSRPIYLKMDTTFEQCKSFSATRT